MESAQVALIVEKPYVHVMNELRVYADGIYQENGS
jgi:hypothetical protein